MVVGPLGWELVTSSPVLFYRTNATLSLPVPAEDGDLGQLKALLNLAKTDANDDGGDSGDDWSLLLSWLVAALFPEMPHPVLLLKGEHGTAKSWTARLLSSLLDPCASQLRTAPRNVEDWAVACAGSWVTCLDNVSDLQPWLQDAIYRAVTGHGLLRRMLYTNSDVDVLAFRRVIGITAIDPGNLHSDLADRLLSIELERIGEADRASDEDLTARWHQHRAAVLGGLLDLTARLFETKQGRR